MSASAPPGGHGPHDPVPGGTDGGAPPPPGTPGAEAVPPGHGAVRTPADGPRDPDGGAETADWRPLPARGAKLAAIGPAIALSLPFVAASGFGVLLPGLADASWLAPAIGLPGALVGARIGVLRHRRVRWRLDRDGLAVRRGRWWETETRVPASRVQHVDLRRGPLERSLGLATLVVHTAGVKLAAVSVSGLDAADAERLRDRLARRQEPDDDAL